MFQISRAFLRGGGRDIFLDNKLIYFNGSKNFFSPRPLLLTPTPRSSSSIHRQTCWLHSQNTPSIRPLPSISPVPTLVQPHHLCTLPVTAPERSPGFYPLHGLLPTQHPKSPFQNLSQIMLPPQLKTSQDLPISPRHVK